MEKVRVLEIIGKRPVGGVGTVMLNYQNYIDRSLVQMDYLIFGEQEESFDEAVKKLGSEVYCFPALSGRQVKRTKEYLESFFEKHKGEYDIVHLHAPYIAKIVFDAANKYGIRHRIIHSHATLYAESRIKALRNRMLWMVSQGKITDRIGCSKAAGDFLFGKKKFIVLKNAIDCDTYMFDPDIRSQIRQKENISKDRIVIGNVGRFSKQKNQTFLIDIFAEIKKQSPNAVLWLLGDGETKADIEAKIREYGFVVEGTQKEKEDYDIKLFGMTSSAKDYYQAMDVMVMPSLFEGLPMVGVEAQACGLPCVFSTAITTEVNVLDCPYISLKCSPKQWAKEILELVEKRTVEDRKKNQKEKLTSMGFNIQSEGERLTQIYLSMIAE